MMETNVNYTLAGAFVITLITAIILGIIWLSSGFSFDRYSNYLVYMKESVAGLNKDAPVEYNGVNVGSVSDIQLNKEDPQLVELTLAITTRTPITRGTSATLATRGLTGLTYVALKDKSADLHPLLAQSGQKYPVIPTSPSIFVRLDTALSMLTTNFQKIAESLQILLDKENQQAIKNILFNLQQITAELSSNNHRLTTIMINTERASAQFGSMLQSGTGAMQTLQTQTLPAAYQVLNNLDEISKTLSDVAEQLKQNPSVLIRGSDQQAIGPGEHK